MRGYIYVLRWMEVEERTVQAAASLLVPEVEGLRMGTENKTKHIIDVKYMLWYWRIAAFSFSRPPRHSSGHRREVGLARWPQLLPVSPQHHRKCFRFVSTGEICADECWARAKKKICSDFIFPGMRLTLQTGLGTFLHTQGLQRCVKRFRVKLKSLFIFQGWLKKDQMGWGLPHWENFDSAKFTGKDVKY